MEEKLVSDERLQELNAAFKGFSDKETGNLKSENIEKALRSVGLNPTPEEVEDIIEEIGNECDLHTFIYVAYVHSRCINVESELVESFEIFDKEGKGFLPVSKIKEILKNIKNPFTDEQIDELLSKVTVTDNNVNYSEFVKAMLE